MHITEVIGAVVGTLAVRAEMLDAYRQWQASEGLPAWVIALPPYGPARINDERED